MKHPRCNAPLWNFARTVRLASAFLLCTLIPGEPALAFERCGYRMDQSFAVAPLYEDLNYPTLLALSHSYSIEEISNRLKMDKGRLPSLSRQRGATFTQLFGPSEHVGELVRSVHGSTGTLHVVFQELRLVSLPDYLGNKRRWESHIHYQTRRDGKWSKRSEILTDHMYVNDLQLRVDQDDVLYLFVLGHGHRPTATSPAPGQYDLLVMRKPNEGAWTKPESCIPWNPRLLHGFDVRFGPRGRLHLVWAPWPGNDKLQKLYSRTYDDGRWQNVQELPGTPTRNLTHPILQFAGGVPSVVAVGQTRDYKKIGSYYLAQEKGRWSQPQLFQDGTAFEHCAAAFGNNQFLNASRKLNDDGVSYAFYRFDGAQTPQRVAEITLPDARQTGAGWWYEFSIAVDASAGRPYLLVGNGGQLLLMRPAPDGKVQAVRVWSADRSDSLVHQTCLEIVDGRVQVTWTIIGSPERHVYMLESDIPTCGWVPVERLLASRRSEIGLTRMDRQILEERVLQEARAYEEQQETNQAIRRYTYALENFSFDHSSVIKRVEALKKSLPTRPQDDSMNREKKPEQEIRCYPRPDYRLQRNRVLLQRLRGPGVPRRLTCRD